MRKGTYSLGFFFGPGLPLAFTGSSTPVPNSLFEPDLGLADSVLTGSSLSLGSTLVEIEGGGNGGSLESDLGSGGGVGSLGGADVDIDNGDFFFGTDFWAMGSCGKSNRDGLGS